MQKIIISTALLMFSTLAFCQTKFQKDFDFYWQTINDQYAYFDRRPTNWEKVKFIYQPLVETIKTENAFIHLLESMNNELYNGHVFLNTNTKSSNRIIPTGSDLKISWINNEFIITEIRQNFNADNSGLKTGMKILKFNNQPIMDGVKRFLPKSATQYDKVMYEYASNMLVAGTHDAKRNITVQLNEAEKYFELDNTTNKTGSKDSSSLETKTLLGNIGYIKINNSLGNTDLIKSFDAALDNLIKTKGLILDLRETPGGGNTTVARAIMGRFINRELPYQKHIYVAEEKETRIKRTTIELVSPRNPIFHKPLVVIVGNWTGSMGEGIAIGFDGMKLAKIIGTKMAGLLGEINTFETPEFKIPFSIPTAQLETINGLPREDFVPATIVNDQNVIIEKAMEMISKRRHTINN